MMLILERSAWYTSKYISPVEPIHIRLQTLPSLLLVEGKEERVLKT